MAILCRSYDIARCCLCGSANDLTGEHKIKASALRREFGEVPLRIGIIDEPNPRLRVAQSTKSKAFHFRAKICRDCNSNRTQNPDKAFDEFQALASESIREGSETYWEDGVFSPPGFEVDSDNMKLLFRYFAKILCLKIAELEGPTPVTLANYALGIFEKNRIWLQVRKDPVQASYEAEFGEWPYAAHGGLVIYCNENSGEVRGFHSSLSVGVVQYVFWFRLHRLEILTLRWFQQIFFKKILASADQYIVSPIEKSKYGSLGFDPDVS